ncbi:TPA: hypothetical protein ACFOZX_001809 [Neisseria meningitidis]
MPSEARRRLQTALPRYRAAQAHFHRYFSIMPPPTCPNPKETR